MKMKTITANIIDGEMIEFLNEQRKRYGSYASFIRALIIDRMDGRQFLSGVTRSYTKQTIEKRIKKKPLPYMSELKRAFELKKTE